MYSYRKEILSSQTGFTVAYVLYSTYCVQVWSTTSNKLCGYCTLSSVLEYEYSSTCTCTINAVLYSNDLRVLYSTCTSTRIEYFYSSTLEYASTVQYVMMANYNRPIKTLRSMARQKGFSKKIKFPLYSTPKVSHLLLFFLYCTS
jgi:hypothetical protein